MMRNKIIVTLVTLLLCMTFLYTPALAVEDDEPDDLHEYINGDNDYADEQIEPVEPVPDPVTLQLMGSDLLELLELFTSDPDFNFSESFLPFTPPGTGSIVDNATDADGKEFFTIMTEAGNIFYLIIDRQRSTENVYFLSMVTEQDLIDLAKENGVIISGSSSLTPPESPPEGDLKEEEPEPEVKPESDNTVLYIIIVTVIGIGGAAYYLIVVKGKKNAQEDDDYYDDDDNFDDNDDVINDEINDMEDGDR